MNEFYQRYKDCDQDEVDVLLTTVCAKGNLEEAKYLLTSNELKYRATLMSGDNTPFNLAVKSGNVELVKYLLTFPEFQPCLNNLKPQFNLACQKGHLPLLRFIITETPFVKNNQNEQNDLQHIVNIGLSISCFNGNVDIMEYLLYSTELPLNAATNYENNYMVTAACRTDRLDILKYLLEIPEFRKNVDIHVENDNIFQILLMRESLDIMQYLIFDYNIKKTKQIKKLLTTYPNEQVETWFKLRELNNKLIKDLPSSKIKSTKKKNKI